VQETFNTAKTYAWLREKSELESATK